MDGVKFMDELKEALAFTRKALLLIVEAQILMEREILRQGEMFMQVLEKLERLHNNSEGPK